jgi:hypothetical protein
MTTKHDAGLDGLHPFAIHDLCQEAERAHPTRVPPPSPHAVAVNLDLLKRALAAGKHGGVREGAP